MRRAATAISALIVAAVAAFLLLRTTSDGERADDAGPHDGDEMPAGSPRAPEPPTLASRRDAAVGDAAGRTSEATRRADGPLVPATALSRIVTVSGRVLRDGDRPAAGAKVEARADARTSVTTTAGDDGRFVLEIERPTDAATSGLLVASDGEGNTAAAGLRWRPHAMEAPGGPRTTIDVGDLRLQVSSTLTVHVRDAQGAPVAADVEVGPIFSSAQAPLARATADESGVAHVSCPRKGMSAEPVVVAARASGRGRGVSKAVVGSKPVDVDVTLVPTRDVEVRVSEKDSNQPIRGAIVSIREQVQFDGMQWTFPCLAEPARPTDAKGRTLLVGVGSPGSLSVGATADGFVVDPSSGRDGWLSLLGDAKSIAIPMVRRMELRWTVDPGDVPTPPDGSTLVLQPEVNSALRDVPDTAQMRGGQVVVSGVAPGYFRAIAMGPDGVQARLVKGDGTPLRTKFRRTPRVEVVARWDDGSPAAGLWIVMRTSGNGVVCAPVETDAAGKAAIERLEALKATVFAAPSADAWAGRSVGEVDLEKGDGRVEFTAPRMREMTVRVFVDGVAGLPANLWSTEFGPVVESDCRVLDRSEATGVVRLRFWPAFGAQDFVLPVYLSGYRADGPLRVPKSAPDPVDLRLDLRRSGALDVAVSPSPDARPHLRLERLDPESRAWTATKYDSEVFGVSEGPYEARMDDRGHWVIRSLAPGRYRVRDVETSTLSDEVDVTPGDTPTPVRIDLSRSGWITGRVVVPAGESAGGILVRLDPAPPEPPWGFRDAAVRTGPDGSFRLRAGDREVVVVAEDPLLAPDPADGSARVAAGAQDVVLRMIRAPVIRIALDRPAPAPDTFPFVAHLWRGPMSGAPAFTRPVKMDGRSVAVGGVEPGRWSVLVDFPDYAPIVVEDVAVGAGETSAGPVALSKGSSLLIDVHAPAGQAVPQLQVYARRLDALPNYSRWASVETKGRVSGLGRGRFRVTASVSMFMLTPNPSGPKFEKDIDVDGTTDVPITIDVK